MWRNTRLCFADCARLCLLNSITTVCTVVVVMMMMMMMILMMVCVWLTIVLCIVRVAFVGTSGRRRFLRLCQLRWAEQRCRWTGWVLSVCVFVVCRCVAHHACGCQALTRTNTLGSCMFSIVFVFHHHHHHHHHHYHHHCYYFVAYCGSIWERNDVDEQTKTQKCGTCACFVFGSILLIGVVCRCKCTVYRCSRANWLWSLSGWNLAASIIFSWVLFVFWVVATSLYLRKYVHVLVEIGTGCACQRSFTNDIKVKSGVGCGRGTCCADTTLLFALTLSVVFDRLLAFCIVVPYFIATSNRPMCCCSQKTLKQLLSLK